MIIRGTRSAIKRQILDYCLDHFEQEDLWMIDSLQIFDPYYLSRKDTEKTRQLLAQLKISRPFTLYQLRDKIFTLKKIPLNQGSTIIISGINSFDNETKEKDEIKSIKKIIISTLRDIRENTRCKIILAKWEGQSSLYAMR